MADVADLADVRAPRTIGELGIPRSLTLDLCLRRALVDGQTSTVELSTKLGLSPLVVTSLIEELRDLHYVQVLGLDGRDFRVGLTELGREEAQVRMSLCRYVDVAPVSLTQYTEIIRRQSVVPSLTAASMRQAFRDLVISEQLICDLGPAARGKGALFLYGPPGTGKSSIAERLIKVHHDTVLVPKAIEVDGQIVTVFDPVIHEPLPAQPPHLDPRWVECKRPCIMVGGELVGSMLDLTLQADSGVYLAPLQMQANNGIFVVDDFGRQTLTPEQLLNRWIVPLDRGIDYLTLDYGVKFEVPFDAKIVFSTNLDPQTLGDEAFYRRIESKVLVPPICDEQFDEVLRRVAHHKGVTVTAEAPDYLRRVSREQGDGDLRPYLPGAVCRILEAVCGFDQTEPVLDPMAVARVARIYFTGAADASGEPAPWIPVAEPWDEPVRDEAAAGDELLDSLAAEERPDALAPRGPERVPRSLSTPVADVPATAPGQVTAF